MSEKKALLIQEGGLEEPNETKAINSETADVLQTGLQT